MANIVETAIAAGSFKTLIKAVQAAGLADALASPGPFTVFAPTDEAFAKLPAGTLEGLLKDLPKLKAVLTYHVAQGKMLAAEVRGRDAVKTLQGQAIPISAKNGVAVGGAKVVQPDVTADNGVIHVIDSVLLPK